MSLPPVVYHWFKTPVPYARALSLQEQIHAHQLVARKASRGYRDYLLLLQHRPVYTFGRRQHPLSDEFVTEASRLRELGADCVSTHRGGQTTYHGPGQLIGYPLLDLGRTSPPINIRDYICRLQSTIGTHLREAHGIQRVFSEHTGVFLDHHTKVASIGIQVRHRLTTHGFSLNVTEEPLAWFSQIVACGLADVKPGCIVDAAHPKTGSTLSVSNELPGVVSRFGQTFGRDMVELDVSAEGEVEAAIRTLEQDILEVSYA